MQDFDVPKNKEAQVDLSRAAKFRQVINGLGNALGNLFVDVFHYLALFAIGGTVVWSAVIAFLGMASKGNASIDDILLLFIYLELGAMVGIYFRTNHMPVRFLIYVAITALTRLLISHVQAHGSPDMGIILITGAILVLALATLIVRFGSSKFPSATTGDHAGR
jgi:protein PsiE